MRGVEFTRNGIGLAFGYVECRKSPCMMSVKPGSITVLAYFRSDSAMEEARDLLRWMTNSVKAKEIP